MILVNLFMKPQMDFDHVFLNHGTGSGCSNLIREHVNVI